MYNETRYCVFLVDAAKKIVTFDYIAKHRKMIVEVQSFGMLLVIVQG